MGVVNETKLSWIKAVLICLFLPVTVGWQERRKAHFAARRSCHLPPCTREQGNAPVTPAPPGMCGSSARERGGPALQSYCPYSAEFDFASEGRAQSYRRMNNQELQLMSLFACLGFAKPKMCRISCIFHDFMFFFPALACCCVAGIWQLIWILIDLLSLSANSELSVPPRQLSSLLYTHFSLQRPGVGGTVSIFKSSLLIRMCISNVIHPYTHTLRFNLCNSLVIQRFEFTAPTPTQLTVILVLKDCVGELVWFLEVWVREFSWGLVVFYSCIRISKWFRLGCVYTKIQVPSQRICVVTRAPLIYVIYTDRSLAFQVGDVLR